jgi:23S rRNA pseudouridine1911/1915/1917 synthase
MNSPTQTFAVNPEDEGTRLDHFLTNRLSGMTRSALKRLITAGQVMLDGAPAQKPGVCLKPGISVSVSIPDAPSRVPSGEDIPLVLIFEDEHLLVLDKRASMVVHPGHGCHSGTVVNALIGRGTPLAAAGGADRPGIVHRLDKGTSGLLIVAKTDEALHGLRTAFTQRKVHKRYLALCWGQPDPADGIIDRSIGRSRGDPTKMAVRGTRGRMRHAISHYATLETVPGFGFMEIFPQTGRTHQIRVHFQSLNHSLVGDERYGGRAWKGVQDQLKRKTLRDFKRLALHAADLKFEHPVTGGELAFSADLPAEFLELLEVLRN